MKKILFAIAVMFYIGSIFAQPNIEITLTTNTHNGGYSPENVLAIWVEKDDGTFVNTILLYANQRKSDLVKWNASSYGYDTDAVTGATRNSHSTYTVNWDCHDFITNDVIVDGNYKIRFELTESNGAGPYYEFDFTKASSNYTLNPTNHSNFTDIEFVYVNDITAGINSHTFSNFQPVKVYPNPSSEMFTFNFKLVEAQKTSLKLYDSQSKLICDIVNNQMFTSGEHYISWDASHLPSGIYYYLFDTEKLKYTGKLIVK